MDQEQKSDTSPLTLDQEAYFRHRVAGGTMVEAHEAAFPGRIEFEARRKAGFRLEQRPEVRERLAEFRAQAMQEAVECGATLVLRLKEEIDGAACVDTPQAIFERLEELGKAAKDAGDLQVAVTVAALRIKMIEVLGKLRLAATTSLLRFAARAKLNADGGGRAGQC